MLGGVHERPKRRGDWQVAFCVQRRCVESDVPVATTQRALSVCVSEGRYKASHSGLIPTFIEVDSYFRGLELFGTVGKGVGATSGRPRSASEDIEGDHWSPLPIGAGTPTIIGQSQ